MTTITSTEAGALGRYINVGSVAAIDDKIKTVIVYCKPTAMSAAGAAYLLSKTPSASTSGPRMYLIDAAGTKVLNYGASSTGVAANPIREGSAGAGVTLNAWQHLVATDSLASTLASDINIFVNTASANGLGSDGSGTRASDAANDLYLMNRGDSASLAREFVGDVAYWAFYDAVLNSTQISNAITNGPMAESTNLIFVFANNTIYHGGADAGATVAVTGRSTRVTGSLPPNVELGDGAPSAPSITTQPSNASVAAGATATFTAAASGSPTPTYQWQRNPGGVGTWADIVAATGASYTTPATTVTGGSANNGDTYRVVATNASGSATSTAATLTVGASNAAPTFPGPSISNLSISQGVAMSAVNVASRFSDTDALTFSAIGTWPAGVTVSSAGVISGTPTTLGNYTALTVRATDTAAQTVDSNSFSIAVTAVADTLNFQASGMEFGARTGLGISTFALDVGSGYRYTVHADGLTLGAALYTSGVVTTDAAGKLPNLVDAAVTAGVMYRVHAIRQSDGAAATFRIAAA